MSPRASPPPLVEGVDFVTIPVADGQMLAGRKIGLWLDAEGHVVWPHPSVETATRKFTEFWAHSGHGSTCRAATYRIEPNGDRGDAEPTGRAEDIIAQEPLTVIRSHRNNWTNARLSTEMGRGPRPSTAAESPRAS